MARETCPAALMITSSPAPDSESSVTSVWRLSCHRATTLALSRTFVQAVRSVVTGWVGSFGCPLPAGKADLSCLHSPNRPMYHAPCASKGAYWVGIARGVSCRAMTHPDHGPLGFCAGHAGTTRRPIMYPLLRRRRRDAPVHSAAKPTPNERLKRAYRWFLWKSALGGSGLRLSDREAISPSSHRTGSGRCEDVSNLEKRSSVPDKARLLCYLAGASSRRSNGQFSAHQPGQRLDERSGIVQARRNRAWSAI